eukprot:1136717-Prorocentrum_minimum.AAC.1
MLRAVMLPSLEWGGRSRGRTTQTRMTYRLPPGSSRVARDVDVKGYDVDVKGCDVDVQGFDVDVKGCDVDVKG